MNLSLDFGNANIAGDSAIEQLDRFGILPELIQEIVTDDLVTEMAVAWSIDLDYTAIEFEQQYAEIAQLPLCQGMNQIQIEAICDRELRFQRFKLARWGDEVETYFQAHQRGFDRTIISMLQVKDAELAQELFFRIESGEISFAAAAIDYSVGIHAQNGGILGPLLWEDLNPRISKILTQLELGKLSQPFKLDDLHTCLRLDRREPAVLDRLRYQFILDRLFLHWRNTEISIRMGYTSR